MEAPLNPTAGDSEPTGQVFCADDLSWTQKVVRRVFPRAWCEGGDLPPEIRQRDIVDSRVYVEASFLDRIRFLLTGRCLVQVTVATEHEVGQTATSSAFSVMPPKWMEGMP